MNVYLLPSSLLTDENPETAIFAEPLDSPGLPGGQAFGEAIAGFKSIFPNSNPLLR
jgi:hypothetical protein